MRLVVITVAILAVIGLWWATPIPPVTEAECHPDESTWVEYVSDGEVRIFPEPWPPAGTDGKEPEMAPPTGVEPVSRP